MHESVSSFIRKGSQKIRIRKKKCAQFVRIPANAMRNRPQINRKNFAFRMNHELQEIGEMKRVGRGGRKVYAPLFPELTAYWSRHTWATIAASLDIPIETISAALGHSYGSPTTAIYIAFDQRKVDDANRRVIDFVNGTYS